MPGEVQAVCKTSGPKDLGCGKTPPELPEYSPEMTGEKLDADTYVWRNEGTLNRENGHFLCTDCYLKAGTPF